MEKQILDCALVPVGLLLMVVYHIWLLRQIIRRPATTVVGINAINRRFWVRAMMEDTSKNGVLAVQTLRNNIMATTLLASTAIMLSSVIALLMTGGGGGHRPIDVVSGDKNNSIESSIKFFSILVCFLVAFLLNVQSIRQKKSYYIYIYIYHMEKQILDCVLVPVGLVLMVAYHIWLLRQIIRRPATTVVGINAINRRFWVRAMMEDTSKNGVLAVQTLRNNIMASTLLASTAIMLASLIAVLMTGGGGGHRPIGVVSGDKNSSIESSIKFFSILMEKQILDCVLVPVGLLLMVAYHIWLLRQIIRRPATTVVGINAINRRFWVRAMMEDTSKNGVLAVQTLRNNIMASTVLASTAIMLASLIAVLMTGGGRGHRPIGVVSGDKNSNRESSLKFFSILVCFLVAFLLNVQSISKIMKVELRLFMPPVGFIKCDNPHSIKHPSATEWNPSATAQTSPSVRFSSHFVLATSSIWPQLLLRIQQLYPFLFFFGRLLADGSPLYFTNILRLEAWCR
ncbi:hypothetical protein BUALT_Bualt06G0140600 [Buddleja alternifolia]|uniref:Gustatory receptor n=1 Tax=Buddleja alternifolia TaxID=168488 RepID=A0AAV6XF77_9LAMI|nr:hypothetical protein BUALT_Bualt06G0140600 [Buddleja alternifolia]